MNIFSALKDLVDRRRMYFLLIFVFIVATFLIIVPVNFLNTIQSPTFITYMGIGQSDIRIDLQYSENIAERYHEVLTTIAIDGDVTRYSPTVTAQFQVVGSDGTLERINIETGDMSIFPLEYLEGTAPVSEHEIALSYLNGKELDKRVGDLLLVVTDGEVKEMTVSGIYQDVTNGGRTAKAQLPVQPEDVLWYVISLDVAPHTRIEDKIAEYTQLFYPAKVTHLEGYLAQTLGHTIEQLELLTILAIVMALSVSVLITALFIQMLIAKDGAQIAILKSIGFSVQDIRRQYVARALLSLLTGLFIGTVIANTAGQAFVSALWSLLGASNISFVINPLQAYLFSPLLLMLCVVVTTLVCTRSIKKSGLAELKGA